MALLSHSDDHDAPRLTQGVRVVLALNVAMQFLQWTLVSDADVLAVFGFQEGSLQRTLWSAGTYMFVHYSLWHLVLNMYALMLFGPRLERATGTRTFLLYYFWCGLGGSLFHLVFVRTGVLVGSSAAVFGVMFAYWQQWPRDEIPLLGMLPMRVWALVMLLVTGNLLAGGLGGEMGASGAPGPLGWIYLAHLGGLAFGWLYFRTPPAASLDRLRQRISPAPDYQDDVPPRAIPRTLPRARAHRDEVDEIIAKSKAVASQQRPSARIGVAPMRPDFDIRASALDRVLDKISLSGLDSLTDDERALLDDVAKRLRGDG